jgi:hypothetical protein
VGKAHDSNLHSPLAVGSAAPIGVNALVVATKQQNGSASVNVDEYSKENAFEFGDLARSSEGGVDDIQNLALSLVHSNLEETILERFEPRCSQEIETEFLENLGNRTAQGGVLLGTQIIHPVLNGSTADSRFKMLRRPVVTINEWRDAFETANFRI